MHKRIKELAHQAGAMASESPLRLSDAEIAKFAQLMLTEVFAATATIKAKYLMNQKATTDFGEKNMFAEGDAALTQLEAELQKRFGVTPADAGQLVA